MGQERVTLGARGEAVVVGYLEALGWRILDRNWRCPLGEIDVIAVDEAGVVVVGEVKTRSGTGFGAPLEAITYAKVRRLRQLAVEWARLRAGGVASLRVDAFGVLMGPGGVTSIDHVRGIEP